MRRPIVNLALILAVPACHCGPTNPTAVTLRVKNATQDPIWVDDTTNQLGLAVQQAGGGGFQTISEALDCACLACDQVCSSCDCSPPMPTAQVVRVDPGMSVERTWTGTIYQNATANCSLTTPTQCFVSRIPALNEQLNLHLCYSPSAPGVTSGD